VVKLLRQEPKTALLVLHLLKKHQLDQQRQRSQLNNLTATAAGLHSSGNNSTNNSFLYDTSGGGERRESSSGFDLGTKVELLENSGGFGGERGAFLSA